MPYTPPSQRSPSTSNPQSPSITRNHSYDAAGPLHPALRPNLPRSRSATYLHKHRRSPSLADEPPAHDASKMVNGGGDGHHAHHTHAHHVDTHHGHPRRSRLHADGTADDKGNDRSILANGVAGDRLSVPAMDLAAPTKGSTASPPDPQLGSDEEDDGSRGRKLEDLAEQLRETGASKRTGHSPTRPEEKAAAAPPVSSLAARTNRSLRLALTPEARRIAHSRSASELHLSQYASRLESPSPGQGTSDSEEVEDDELRIKPPLIRKKSGELVKPALRPASRRRPSSMPGTPTYSKAVHFNEDIEQVRHFLQVDRPIAVSAGSSPVEAYDSESEYPFESYGKKAPVEWEIRTANFPADSPERQALPVRLERIFLSPDSKTLIGSVACANISFHKAVVARFTLDYWKTVSEISADYNNDVRRKQQAGDGYDRFNFNIKLADQAHLESKTLLLCIRYNVNGQEFWDNNNSMNFQVDFIKKTAARKAKVVATQGAVGVGSGGAGSLGALPRSRQSPSGPRPRSFPAGSDDDFAASFEFGTGDSLLRNQPAPSTLRLKSGARKGSIFPDQARQRQHGGQGAFSTRYDFGASLTAALTHAQNAMESDKSADEAKAKPAPAAFEPAAPAVQPVPGPRPDKISSERPDLHSQEYHDLIQKFCYFGSAAGSTMASTPRSDKAPPAKGSGIPQTDGAAAVIDSGSESNGGSARSSASNSPPSPPPTKEPQRHHLYSVSSSSSGGGGGGQHQQQAEPADMHTQPRATTPPFHPISPTLLAYRSPSPALSSYQDYPYQALPPQVTQC